MTTDTSSPLDTSQPKQPRTSFAGDVLKLVSGTTFAQALTVLAAPILARLYAPEAFGILALFNSVTAILSVIVCLRYEFAIMLPESDEEAVNLLGVSVMFTILLSLVSLPLIGWGREPLARWLNAPQLADYLWLVPAALFLGGVFKALNYWNSRTRHFGRLSIARVISATATTGTQLGAGLAGYATGASLLIANVIGSLVSTLVLGTQIWRDDKNLFARAIHWREMFVGLGRYRKFPLFDTWAALLNSASWQLPAFLLSTFFSTTVVGYYALGFRILQTPMGLIGNSIGQVFFQRAAEAQSQGKLAPLVENALRRLVAIGLFPMLVLTVIGSDLYIVIFGLQWEEAGIYTQILSVWAFFWFISSPLSTLFGVLEKQEFSLVLNIFIFSTRFIALGIGGLLGDARLAVFLFATSGVLVYGYVGLSITAAAGVAWSRVFGILFSYFLLFMPAGVILLMFKLWGTSPLILVFIASALLGVYLLYVLKRESGFHLQGFGKPKGK